MKLKVCWRHIIFLTKEKQERQLENPRKTESLKTVAQMWNKVKCAVFQAIDAE